MTSFRFIFLSLALGLLTTLTPPPFPCPLAALLTPLCLRRWHWRVLPSTRARRLKKEKQKTKLTRNVGHCVFFSLFKCSERDEGEEVVGSGNDDKITGNLKR